MKIIEHGETYKEVTCEMCHARLGYSYRDIEHKIMHDAYNGKVKETVTEFFFCPECGCRIVLSLKIDGVPREIRGHQ